MISTETNYLIDGKWYPFNEAVETTTEEAALLVGLPGLIEVKPELPEEDNKINQEIEILSSDKEN